MAARLPAVLTCIGCGGGTTDLSSYRFSIDNRRVAYNINIQTAYENGDTDFGGNNLTFRIMQMLKISLTHQLGDIDFADISELISKFDADVFREVDRNGGAEKVYTRLDEEYAKAEAVIPTRFKEYEHSSRADYYAVKNNFYFLFEMAEKVKKEFIPGKIIESTRRSEDESNLYELKLICLNGAIKYIKDKKFGYADIQISNDRAAFPYIITAFTHTGDETVLIDGLERKKTDGFISRNMADLILKLLLKDPEGRLRYTYNCSANPRNLSSRSRSRLFPPTRDILRRTTLMILSTRNSNSLYSRRKSAGVSPWCLYFGAAVS